MEQFDRLVEIMAVLRSPEGCPWDREQTIDSLKPFVLEETYEVLEAIDRHDHAALCEELGDFLFVLVEGTVAADAGDEDLSLHALEDSPRRKRRLGIAAHLN